MSGKSIVFVSNTSEFFVSHRLPLARHLAESGWHIAIISDDGPHGSELIAEGFEVYRIGFRREFTGVLSELRNFVKICRIIGRLKPAFVHNIALKSAVFGSLAARFFSKAVIVNSITGLGLTFVASERPLTVRRRVVEMLLRFSLASKRCHSILQNQDDLELLASRRIVERSRATVIYGSGVDAREYVLAERKASSASLNVVLAARLLWSKGVGDFVAAADMLKSAFPHASFLIAGKVDSASTDHISETQLLQWSENSNALWIGYIEDMKAFLGKADIVVLPSYYREGVPKVLIEAAMSGRPIVTTDSPGCREAVVHNETGLLVPPRNVAALAEAIGELLGSEDLRRQFGSQARKHAMGRFELQQVLEQTTAVYQMAAREHDGPAIAQ